MNERVRLQQIFPVLLVLVFLVAIGLLSQQILNPPVVQLSSELSQIPARFISEEAFDAERAADLSAARWQAMGEFYEKNGMLTRDNFDYEKAADLSAARWQAMAKYYADQGLLTREDFDYEKAADISAARWQAMAEF